MTIQAKKETEKAGSKETAEQARFIKKRKHARDKGLQALYQWQLSGEDLEWIKDHYIQEQGVATGDKAYFLELLFEIPACVNTLDDLYRKHIENFEDHVDPIETNILRIATYELINHLEIPFKVVINEAVNLAKVYGADDSHKFVNGVLDPLAKELRPIETKA
ncbi:MAG: N utilization substance protein B [Gammaproteobacteria bacterium]|jgi:N utilization substance protein B